MPETVEVIPPIPPVVTAPTETPIPPPIESAPPEKKDEEKPKEPGFMSDKFAALARKEKANVKERQEISEKRAELEKKITEFKAQQTEFERWQKIKANAKLDPDAYLKEADLDYTYLTQKELKGVDPKVILEKTTEQVEALRREIREGKEREAEQLKADQQKAYEEQVQNLLSTIDEVVDENADTYELIKLHNQQNLVWSVIQEAAKHDETLSIKEAADRVEKYLTDHIEKSITTAKKFKDKYTAPKKDEPKTPIPGTPTLSNNLTSTTPVKPGYMTDKEREQRALDALNKALGQS